MKIEFGGQTFLLRTDKTMFWVEQKVLLAADLHLGKIRHFRKHGSGIPDLGVSGMLSLLNQAIVETGAREIIYLGDLFHTRDLDTLHEMKEIWKLPVRQSLIPGNHDRLEDNDLEIIDIETYSVEKGIGNIILTHIPPNEIPEDKYFIAGHVHPAVRIYGRGKQSLKLPCFHFGTRLALMPALGEFTGTHTIYLPGKTIAITEESLWALEQ